MRYAPARSRRRPLVKKITRGYKVLRMVLAGFTVLGGLTVTGPAAPSGFGSGAVSGYVVSDVAYEDSGNPGWVDSVRLRLDAAATEVNVRLDRSSKWAECSLTRGTNWRCSLSQPVAVADITQLQVMATG